MRKDRIIVRDEVKRGDQTTKLTRNGVFLLFERRERWKTLKTSCCTHFQEW